MSDSVCVAVCPKKWIDKERWDICCCCFLSVVCVVWFVNHCCPLCSAPALWSVWVCVWRGRTKDTSWQITEFSSWLYNILTTQRESRRVSFLLSIFFKRIWMSKKNKYGIPLVWCLYFFDGGENDYSRKKKHCICYFKQAEMSKKQYLYILKMISFSAYHQIMW